MAGDGKPGRSVVTDFGPRIEPRAKRESPSRAPAPAVAEPPAGKKASRARAGRAPEARRARPETTEAPPAALPGDIIESKREPRVDQARLAARNILQAEASGAVELRDEVLRSKDDRLFMINDPDSRQAAAFRVLRHQIEAMDDTRVIAVSSPTSGTGTTTAAANLALALCECRRANVLLVEANTRRPAVARLFRFEPDPGLGEQIERYHTAPGTAWQVTSFPLCGLHIIALAKGAEPAPLLDGPAFRYAIGGLATAGYDRLVIDCAPVLDGADVNLVQDAADGVLLVARARQTTNRQMRESIERLAPAKILGTVLLGE